MILILRTNEDEDYGKVMARVTRAAENLPAPLLHVANCDGQLCGTFQLDTKEKWMILLLNH